MHWHGGGPAVGVLQEYCRGFDLRKSPPFEEHEQSLFPWHGEDESYGDLLDADEFEGVRVAVLFLKAELDDFAHALHEGVEILGLGMAAVKSGNGGDVEAFLVLLDQDREFSFLLQASALFTKVYHEEAEPSERANQLL
jgi:hypothetical protein